MYPHPCFHIALRQPPLFHAPPIGRARGWVPHVRQRTGHDRQRRHLRGTHRPHPRVGVDGHRLASGEIEDLRQRDSNYRIIGHYDIAKIALRFVSVNVRQIINLMGL